MIKDFQTVSDYEQATLSLSQTDVALIESVNRVIVHGVNVLVPYPRVGDVVFLDEANKIVFVAWETLQKPGIPAVWTHVGYVFCVKGRSVSVVNKNNTYARFKGVERWAFDFGGIPQEVVRGSITINYKDADHTGSITANFAGKTPNQAASAINSAIASNGQAVYFWATFSGNTLIIQSDNYWTGQGVSPVRLYKQDSGSMPYRTIYATYPLSYIEGVTDSPFIKNGACGAFNGNVVNVDRAVPYFSVNGTTGGYDSMAPVFGQKFIVKESYYDESEWFADVRDYYGSYENYVASFLIVKDQAVRSFDPLIVGKSASYAEMKANDQNQNEKVVFPALAECMSVNYNNDALTAGKWHLITFNEMCYLLDPGTIALLGNVTDKMGGTKIDPSLGMCNLSSWYYNGNMGICNTTSLDTSIAQAVVEIEL